MNKFFYYIAFLLFACIILFPLFYRLDASQLTMWDESRYAVNAIEMQHTSNPLVVTFDGKPDWWNSKPPLAVWIMALSVKVFGINELGIRLPSAFAALFSVVLLLLFSKKVIGNIMPGVIASLTLVSTTGIIRPHVARTGDVDSIFTFLILLYSLSFLTLLIYKPEKKNVLMGIFTIGLIFAFLTKGIAALIPLPGLLIFAITQNKIRYFLSSWQFYVAVTVFMVIAVGYYILREAFDPGYVNAVLKNEFGLFSTESSWKNRAFLFYFKNLVDNYFYPFAYVLPLSIISAFFTKNKILQKTIVFSTIFSLCFLLIHSSSRTGNEWYDAPAYPFLALLFGSSVYVLYENIDRYLKNVSLLPKLITGSILLALLFYYPYSRVIKSIISRTNKIYHLELEGAFMKKLHKENPSLNQYTVTYYHLFSDQVKFYASAYNQQGANIKLTQHRVFQPGEIVLTCQPDNIYHIIDNYDCSIIEAWGQCRMFKINSDKK